MKLSHSPGSVTARFDDPNLIGYAGLIPAMRLAEQAGLYDLALEHVKVPTDKGANPHYKIATLIAGMVAGADSIDDMDLVRHGGMDRVFEDWRAPSTLGSFLREFTFGHSRQVDAVASRFLRGLDQCSPLFGPPTTGDEPVMVDIDETLVEVFSASKHGAGIGYTKIRGLSAVIMTVSTPSFAPVIIANRLRKGAAASVKGASRILGDGFATLARSSLKDRQGWLRADAGFYAHSVVSCASAAGLWTSVTVRMNPSIRQAITMINDDQWTTITYPNAI
jgi:hypothetical protein